tara:strand:+ start:391 stop:774 length:384 start_codon:yes stop_codon:yes gene_type:complete
LNISKKKTSSTSNINKPNDINRGVQFILLNGRKKKNSNTFQLVFPGGKKMAIDTEIILTLLLPVSLLFFFVGLLGGWVARDYMLNYREIPRPHPEMFDINGNLVPDEVIAFNFENYHDDNESSEEDD